jgi:hypothetical protein
MYVLAFFAANHTNTPGSQGDDHEVRRLLWRDGV